LISHSGLEDTTHFSCHQKALSLFKAHGLFYSLPSCQLCSASFWQRLNVHPFRLQILVGLSPVVQLTQHPACFFCREWLARPPSHDGAAAFHQAHRLLVFSMARSVDPTNGPECCSATYPIKIDFFFALKSPNSSPDSRSFIHPLTYPPNSTPQPQRQTESSQETSPA
jgi:hypothetical protein